ncbi:MAG TPA: hypothetical protein VFC74_06220 [Oscillospiraceae bacterium]|nr:hypothetical protein [Oscillospiraceae bacterium]
MYENDRGAALPLILVIMLVLGLLGATLIQYSVADAAQVAKEANKLEAHYAARAGADAMADFLIKNPGKIADVAAKTNSSTYATGNVGDATFRTDVNETEDIIEIQSIGTANGVEQAVTLILSKDDNPNLFSNAIAQTSKDKHTLLLHEVDIKDEDGGDNVSVEATGEILPTKENQNDNFRGTQNSNSSKYYPPPVFPKEGVDVSLTTFKDIVFILVVRYN